MLWKEFKSAAEQAGIKDDTEVVEIKIHTNCDKSFGKVKIRECHGGVLIDNGKDSWELE